MYVKAKQGVKKDFFGKSINKMIEAAAVPTGQQHLYVGTNEFRTSDKDDDECICNRAAAVHVVLEISKS